MNSTGLDVLRRALPGLRIILEEAQRVRDRVEAGDPVADEHFPYYLKRLYGATALALEAAGLLDARRDLQTEWQQATANGVGNLVKDPFDFVFSPAIGVIYNVIEGIKAVVGQSLDPIDAYNLDRFEKMLRRTAELIHRQAIQPKSEADIQRVMDELLSAAFVDYSPQIPISGIIKNFKPDGGVRSIKAAVEFKYVKSPQEVRVALSGILEDTAGYRGSADWVRFYSVIYMTGPYESEARFAEELRRVEAPAWTPILVNGAAAEQLAPKKRLHRARKN
ncbi:MAG TPA: hypothetical protein VK539_29565 [Myxococcaceae bacterium]|nr:hypothetical protein [Myxococcaceae bacterium]